MYPVRIIARLDVKTENVVKGVHLEGLRVVGKPGELGRRYYEQGADELIYVDIVASLYGRNSILKVVQEVASEVFVPLTVGGGIRSIADIRAALRAGADKVAINTAAIANPDFLREAAETFGSQCIVLSVEAQRRSGDYWEVMTDNGRERTGIEVRDWVCRAEELGAGEILLTSVDREGTRRGFETPLLQGVHGRVSIPVIACGGAGSADHVVDVIREGCADAVACASILHYDTVPMPALKAAIADAGFPVRA